jgi:hypothetical protein
MTAAGPNAKPSISFLASESTDGYALMQADYSVELGREDPALELPWSITATTAATPATTSATNSTAAGYFDLKRHPELVSQIPEAADSPELSAFLTRINAAAFPLQTAKCDTWFSREISPEEEIFGGGGKFVSYVDLVFAAADPRLDFEKHEALAKNLCRLLHRAPEMKAAIELVIRRCYYHPDANPDESAAGFCITAYVSGFGDDEPEARRPWGIAITLLQHALVQVVGHFRETDPPPCVSV